MQLTPGYGPKQNKIIKKSINRFNTHHLITLLNVFLFLSICQNELPIFIEYNVMFFYLIQKYNSTKMLISSIYCLNHYQPEF